MGKMKNVLDLILVEDLNSLVVILSPPADDHFLSFFCMTNLNYSKQFSLHSTNSLFASLPCMEVLKRANE